MESRNGMIKSKQGARDPWLIILAAGKPTTNVSNVLTPQGPLFLPLGGKPVGAAILSAYHRLGIERVSIVARATDSHMAAYVRQRFGGLFSLDFHFVSESFAQHSGPANSLLSILEGASAQDLERPLIVVFGDQLTVVDIPDAAEEAIIFTSEFVASESLSYVKVDLDRVAGFVAKGQEIDGRGAHQLRTEVGGYYFPDSARLTSLSPAPDLLQMADLAAATHDRLIARPVSTWIDASRWDYAREKDVDTVASRSFNSIDIDATTGVLTKRSQVTAKIALEVDYYRNLPKQLSIFFPRLVDAAADESSYSIEYYPMKTVSEYFVFWGLSSGTWEVLASRLATILKTFSRELRHTSTGAPSAYFDFYWDKTISRIDQISGPVRPFITQTMLEVNGTVHKGWPALKAEVENRLRQMSDSTVESVVHGDFCFSNILFEPTAGLVRLIDPRGSFVRPGIRGDIRYDLAKLMHSVDGMYDFIIHDMYTLKYDDRSIDYTVLSDHDTRQVRDLFVKHILREFPEVAMEDLRILEATLFLSMIPLHSDFPDRQIVFWAIGLTILNEIL